MRVTTFAASLAIALPVAVAAVPLPFVEGAVLAGLRESLETDAANGDPVARQSLAAFDDLDSAQRTELTAILIGTSEATAAEPTDDARPSVDDGAEVLTDGDAQWITESGEGSQSGSSSPNAEVALSAMVAPAGSVADRAATMGRSVWGTQWFKFAGITLTETKVWGRYSTSGSSVVRVTDWGVQLVKNYQPFTSVTVLKQSAVVSGSSVTFKGKVRVDRGPVPNTGWVWSSREGYHTVRANSSGVVSANGWT